VFIATVLKTLGRAGSDVFLCFFILRIETPIIKTPTEKKGFLVKKVEGRRDPIDRVGLPETQDFFRLELKIQLQWK